MSIEETKKMLEKDKNGLLPCMCGNRSLELNDDVHGKDYSYLISCCRCGCTLTMRDREVVTEARLYMSNLKTAWNTRPQIISDLIEEVEVAEKHVNEAVKLANEAGLNGVKVFGAKYNPNYSEDSEVGDMFLLTISKALADEALKEKQ